MSWDNVTGISTTSSFAGTASYALDIDNFKFLPLSSSLFIAVNHTNYKGNNPTSSNNIFIGSGSGQLITTARQNTVMGMKSAARLTTGTNNTIIGFQNAVSASTVTNNVIIGSDNASTATLTGTANLLIGIGNGTGLTSANNHIMIGSSNGIATSTGNSGSILIGNNIGSSGGTSDNVIIGNRAMSISGVGRNIAIGSYAGNGQSTDTRSPSNSSGSIYIGVRTGIVSGSNLGGGARNNTIVIGENALSPANDTTIIGNDQTTFTYLRGVISGSSLSITTAITASNILITDDIRFGDSASDRCRLTGSLELTGSLLLPNGSAPTSISSSGRLGEIRWDSQAVYICIVTDTWKKSALVDF